MSIRHWFFLLYRQADIPAVGSVGCDGAPHTANA